ncbi:hypothetical protein ROHU_032173 [Labeo rohita]|uniref:Uncharacterized protein n=2 Tax=Labeonini TaxID=2743697 RepID=A0A498LHE6_LABRO|nr:hypothetical protein ROHU_032173 [Labeo rohita]
MASESFRQFKEWLEAAKTMADELEAQKTTKKENKREFKTAVFPGGIETSMGTSYQVLIRRIDLLNPLAQGSMQKLRRVNKRSRVHKRSQVLAGRICGDTFHRVFREFAFCNFKKEDLCLTEPFKSPACTPDMHYRFKKSKGYWPYLERMAEKLPELQPLTMMKPFLSVMHAKAHTGKCEVRWGSRNQVGAGNTVGEKVEQVNSFLSRVALTTKYMTKSGRADGTIGRWRVSICPSEKIFQKKHSSHSSQEELQREIDEIIYSIRRKKQDLYQQNDSSQTRQRKRQRLGELKKTLSEKIVLYNAIPGCEGKIDTEAACSLCDVILPWEAKGDVVSLHLKRRLFDQVMLVRRLEEEKIIIIKEMTQHYQHLKKVLDKLDRLLGETEEMKIHECPASNDMWGPDEGLMGGKCGPHYGLAPGIHIGASRGSPDVLKVGPVRYPGQQQQPQGTCPLPPHLRDGHASTQTVADKAPRQSPPQLRRAGPIGPRMATADPATQPAAWDRQGMEPRALWAQEQPPHPHRTRGPANAQEDQAAPDAPPGCAGTRPRPRTTIAPQRVPQSPHTATTLRPSHLEAVASTHKVAKEPTLPPGQAPTTTPPGPADRGPYTCVPSSNQT